MKKLILLLISIIVATDTWAGCPTNELIYNILTPINFSFEKRDGSGEDITNTANKRMAISYWDGSVMKWWNGTDWTSTTEQLLTMTQVTGSQYRYNYTPNSTVSGQFLMMRFDEINDVDVTTSCLAYVQPANRFDDNTDYAKISDGTGAGQIDTANGAVVTVNSATLAATTHTGAVIPTVTSVTNAVTLPSIPANWITAAGIADDAGNEIADQVWDEELAAHTTADTPGKVVNMLTQDAVTLSTDVALTSIVGQILDDGTAWSYTAATD